MAFWATAEGTLYLNFQRGIQEDGAFATDM